MDHSDLDRWHQVLRHYRPVSQAMEPLGLAAGVDFPEAVVVAVVEVEVERVSAGSW
jgi:hypothetical protein